MPLGACSSRKPVEPQTEPYDLATEAETIGTGRVTAFARPRLTVPALGGSAGGRSTSSALRYAMVSGAGAGSAQY